MRAATMLGVREPLTVMDLPDPTLEPDGAIVRVEANGVCRSDWHGWVGDWDWVGVQFEYPHVLGHEFCGVVEEVGSEVRRFRAGDRVIVPFSQGDGTCEMCRTGHSNVCENGVAPGFSYWGGFGRLSHVPVADLNLVRMPDSMTFLVGAALGCRYMTSFHGVAHRAEVRAGEWVAVHGCGGIGLSAVQIATALGANVIAVDIDPAKLEFARKVGAVETVLAGNNDPAEAVVEITKGGAHVAVDALGIKATCQATTNSLRTRGRHLQIGQTGRDEEGNDRISDRRDARQGAYGLRLLRHAACPLRRDAEHDRNRKARSGGAHHRHDSAGEDRQGDGVDGRLRHSGLCCHRQLLSRRRHSATLTSRLALPPTGRQGIVRPLKNPHHLAGNKAGGAERPNRGAQCRAFPLSID